MNDLTLPLRGLSPVEGKNVIARFDGGMLSSDGGVLALAEVEKRYRIGEREQRAHGLGASVVETIEIAQIRFPYACFSATAAAKNST